MSELVNRVNKLRAQLYHIRGETYLLVASQTLFAFTIVNHHVDSHLLKKLGISYASTTSILNVTRNIFQ